MISTGGTAAALRAAGLAVTDISTGHGISRNHGWAGEDAAPEIRGGLLALRDAHADVMKAHGIGGIDLLVSNLYPFEATIAKGASFEEVIENIDVGGPRHDPRRRKKP